MGLGRGAHAGRERAGEAGTVVFRAGVGVGRILRIRREHHADRAAEARGFLVPVYDRFTEGFETADLKAAKALLHGCG